MEDITAVGLVLALVVFGVREFFGWLSKKSLQNTETRLKALESGLKSNGEKLEQMKNKLDTLYDWHDKSDQDGVKIWYIRKSLETALDKHAEAVATLAKNAELQTQILQQLVEANKELHTEIRSLQRNSSK